MMLRYQRNSSVEAAPLNGEAVLFNPATKKFCLLNRTMSFIWSQLGQPATPEQISSQIVRSFNSVSESQARQDVEQALAQMVELGLLTPQPGS